MFFYKEFYDAGFVYVGNLFNGNGKFLEWNTFATRLPQYAFLRRCSIIHSLPKRWKENIDMSHFNVQNQDHNVRVVFSDVSYGLEECTTKVITPLIISKYFITPNHNCILNAF